MAQCGVVRSEVGLHDGSVVESIGHSVLQRKLSRWRARKDGAVYAKNSAVCLETQMFPDAINKRGVAGWPDVVLKPGATYEHHMVHAFSTTPTK